MESTSLHSSTIQHRAIAYRQVSLAIPHPAALLNGKADSEVTLLVSQASGTNSNRGFIEIRTEPLVYAAAEQQGTHRLFPVISSDINCGQLRASLAFGRSIVSPAKSDSVTAKVQLARPSTTSSSLLPSHCFPPG